MAPGISTTNEGPIVIGRDGWATVGVVKRASAHFDARQLEENAAIDTVVIHNISLPPLTFGSGTVENFFCDTLNFDEHPELESLRGVRVSSHFLISRQGVVTQFVSCSDRAWHAGVSCFNGKTRCNDFTIGIELEGTDFVPFDERQYVSLENLLKAISQVYPIEFVVGHSDIAPERKTDPGPYFDWVRLFRNKDYFGSPRFVGAAAQKQFSVLSPWRDVA